MLLNVFRSVLLAGLLFTLAVPLATGWAQVAQPSPTAVPALTPDPASKEDQLALLINRARIAAGRQPLARADALDRAARGHSQDMVQHDYLDHVGSDGSTPEQRAEQAGYHVPPNSPWIVVEIISAISADPAGPLDWWLNQSPEIHGKVLLDPRWREMGVGYAAGGTYGNYWTVLVGCRPGVLPAVNVDGRSYQSTELCGPATSPAMVPGPTAAPSPTAPTSMVSDGGSKWQLRPLRR